MRIYLDEQKTELFSVICNMCGKEMTVEGQILKEGCFHGDHTFGYFSNKDGQTHKFDLCEECYDKIVKRFKISIEEQDIKEFM
ncbi:MAG TPA: hypothetical protein VJZ04_07040 [Lachnospiraceae bacterium]|nr:hypothetical protein [Lachnospiraceae bacterium]